MFRFAERSRSMEDDTFHLLDGSVKTYSTVNYIVSSPPAFLELPDRDNFQHNLHAE